jgi:hypothetical protein
LNVSYTIYLRIETVNLIRCQLITGKSKVAPLKRSTIPRLELCGSVLTARLLHLVKNIYADRLEVNEIHAWTDSTTALAWIRSSPHYYYYSYVSLKIVICLFSIYFCTSANALFFGLFLCLRCSFVGCDCCTTFLLKKYFLLFVVS